MIETYNSNARSTDEEKHTESNIDDIVIVFNLR